MRYASMTGPISAPRSSRRGQTFLINEPRFRLDFILRHLYCYTVFIRISRNSYVTMNKRFMVKTERFEMRLHPETLKQVDMWRADQPGLPSRAEAVRRLVDAGLSVTGEQEIQISGGEKLLLMMLGDLHQHLFPQEDPKPGSGISSDLIKRAIAGGHDWALQWEHRYLSHSHVDSRQVLSEVVDMLEMWSFLESGYAKLSRNDKDRVKSEAPFGGYVEFPGFDGNNEEEHFEIAHFLIEGMGRFARFKGRDFNSSMPNTADYRRMLAVFKPIQPTLTRGVELSASQIIDLLKAQAEHD